MAWPGSVRSRRSRARREATRPIPRCRALPTDPPGPSQFGATLRMIGRPGRESLRPAPAALRAQQVDRQFGAPLRMTLGPALRPAPAALRAQQVDRQFGPPASRAPRRARLRHLDPDLREPPCLVLLQLPRASVVWSTSSTTSGKSCSPMVSAGRGSLARAGCRYTDWSACMMSCGSPCSSRSVRSVQPSTLPAHRAPRRCVRPTSPSGAQGIRGRS